MRRLAFILILAVVPCRAAEVIAPPQELAPTRELILQSIHDQTVPGCAVAVIKQGKLVWVEGFGEADLTTHAAPTPETPFPLTSCSKPLTAFAFLRMRERGLIEAELQRQGGDAAQRSWLEQELRKPLDPAEVARAAQGPEQASEIYLASLLVADETSFMERAYLDELARQLKLPDSLKRDLEAQV